MTKVTEEMIEYGVGVINHRMNNEGEDWAFDITGAISQILHGAQRMTAAQDSGEQISKEKVAEVKHRSFPQLRVEDAFLQWWHAESGWSEGAEDDASLSEGNLAREAFKAGALLAVPNAVQVDREEIGHAIIVKDDDDGTHSWETYFVSDKQSESLDTFDIPAEAHPPGTYIVVYAPPILSTEDKGE